MSYLKQNLSLLGLVPINGMKHKVSNSENTDVGVPKGTLCRCECEMPTLDGRKGLCGKCERTIVV